MRTNKNNLQNIKNATNNNNKPAIKKIYYPINKNANDRNSINNKLNTKQNNYTDLTKKEANNNSKTNSNYAANINKNESFKESKYIYNKVKQNKEAENQPKTKNNNNDGNCGIKYIRKIVTTNNQIDNEKKNQKIDNQPNYKVNSYQASDKTKNTYSKGSNNNIDTNNNYRNRRMKNINDKQLDIQNKNNNEILASKKNNELKEKNDKFDKEKKKYFIQKEPEEENKVLPKETKSTNTKKYITGNKYRKENDEEDIQENLHQKEPKKESIITSNKSNTNQNKNKIQNDNALKEDSQNSSNKKDLKEGYKDIPKKIENSEVKDNKIQIVNKSKKADVLKKDNQNSSNKKEVNEVNKDTSKDNQNTSIAKDINGFKHQSDQKDVIEEDKPNISFKKDIKEENKDTPKEVENKTQIKNKDNKDEVPKFANIKKIDKPTKIIDLNLKTFQNNTNNEKTNDIKSLVPEADKYKKKDPKHPRFTSTCNRIVKKDDKTEDINNINSEKSRNELSKPGLIGLKNIGATCYMNATLQCFSNCASFKNNLLKLYKELETGKDSKYKLSFALAEVIKNLWGILHHKIYEPYNFKNIISEMNPIFKGIAANDPKDLVLFIIQTIHIELNKPNPNFESNEGNNYDAFWKEYNDFMNVYKRQSNSIITEEFHFYTNNMTTCCNCNTTIHNVQTNNILFFPLEEVRKFKGYYNNYVTIYDCFEYNEMQTSSQFHCNSCNFDAMSYSCTKFVSSAKTLIINLNRGHGMEYNVNIVFEEYLNIRKFVFKSESPYYYELTGVICHFGDNDDSGHFIAYCKNCDDCNWYKFNDGVITKCSFQDVREKGMHYVLFYSYIQMED